MTTRDQLTAIQAASWDAFGRRRVSNPATVLDAKLEYDLLPLIFDQAVTTGGSCAHQADESCALLSVDGQSGAKVIRQTRRYCTYQPGKSHLIEVSGSMGPGGSNVRSRMGYFDGLNGAFLEKTEEGLWIVSRSSISGETVENRIHQSEWNQDSHYDIEDIYSQILAIDLQFLAVGLVRVGFNRYGVQRWAHWFQNDNVRLGGYWSTASLPVRYEIENTASGDASYMRQICCSVQSEGGWDLNKGFSFGRVAPSDVAVTTRRPVMSIRPTASFLTKINRMGVVPVGFEATASTNSSTYELVYGGTLTGASWSPHDATNSGVEYDVSATSISGGVVVGGGIIPTSGPKSSVLNEEGFPSLTWLTNSIDGTTTTPITLVCTSQSATSTVRAAWRWTEIR